MHVSDSSIGLVHRSVELWDEPSQDLTGIDEWGASEPTAILQLPRTSSLGWDTEFAERIEMLMRILSNSRSHAPGFWRNIQAVSMTRIEGSSFGVRVTCLWTVEA